MEVVGDVLEIFINLFNNLPLLYGEAVKWVAASEKFHTRLLRLATL